MSEIYLSLWDSSWLAVEFNTVNHRIRRRLASSAKDRVKGFAHKHRGDWFLLYEFRGRLMLFFKGTNNFIDDISIDVSTEASEKFFVEISSGGRVIFSDRISFPRVLDFPSTIDERRQENFFFWLKSIVDDEVFKGDMIRLWSKA